MVNISSAIQNGSKYLARQARDIAIYGEKKVTRTSDVTENLLEKFTPHRRLSKKPCTLSDNQYFLDKFESSTKEGLPKVDNWDSLSVEEKIDYIVKSRYRSLLANKIMDAVKHKPIEHNIMLSENGEILSHNIGDSKHVNIENAVKLAEELYEKRIKLEKKGGKFIHIEAETAVDGIHNHPECYPEITSGMNKKTKDFFKEFFGIKPEAEVNPISIKDIIGDVKRITNAFVVDSGGHKFKFIPKTFDIKTPEQLEEFYLILSKFEYLAKSVDNQYRTVYKEAKEELEKLLASGNFNQEMLQEKQLCVMKSFADMLREQLTQEEYRKFLTSDFVKENIGIFKELP